MGWVNQGPWLYAYLSLYSNDHPSLSASIKQDAYNAILEWADTTLAAANESPYGFPMINATYSQVGWYFSGDQVAFPMMMAYDISHDPVYRDQIIKTWNYLLGGNPTSKSFISGLGDPDRSPRWLTHEIGQYMWVEYKNGNGGWSELPPRIPNADLQSGGFPWYLDNSWNAERKSKVYPVMSEYPPLYRYSDVWNVSNEFVTLNIARNAASIIPLIPTRPSDMSIMKTLDPIVVDGVLDEEVWDIRTPVAKPILGTPNNTAKFGALWDDDYLYIGFEISDSTLYNDSISQWDDDSVEVYIDGDNSKGIYYDANDRQFALRWNDTVLWEKNGNTSGAHYAWSAVPGGYAVEFAVPWSNIGIVPSADHIIGLDIANNDDDSGGLRDSQLMWFGTNDNWTNPSNFGYAVLSSIIAGE